MAGVPYGNGGGTGLNQTGGGSKKAAGGNSAKGAPKSNPGGFWGGGGTKDAQYLKRASSKTMAAKKRGLANQQGESDPLADLYGYADQFWVETPGSGGSGGSPGNGASIRALMAALNQTQGDATNRYNTNKGTIKDIYGDLTTELRKNAPATQQRYDTLRGQSAEAGSQIASQTLANQAAHDEQRRIALQSLGINPEAAVNQENAATNQGLAQLAQSNATFGNLQGTLGAAQVSRDNLDVQGSRDAEILAQKALMGTYEDYLRQLDQQRAEAQASYVPPSGGSGGTGPTRSNPMLDMINEGVMNKMMYQNGLGKNPTGEKPTAPAWQATPQGVTALQKALGGRGGLNDLGKPMSAQEIYSRGGPAALQTFLGMQGKL